MQSKCLYPPSNGVDEQLISKIVEHEGMKPSAYQDSLGYWTIGIGTLIDERKGGKLTTDECFYLCRNRLALRRKELSAFKWFTQQNTVRQDCLVELAFNLGTSGLLSFKKMIAALEVNNYSVAAKELKDSKWSTQVSKSRVDDISCRLFYGKYK
jgi:lysozyme